MNVQQLLSGYYSPLEIDLYLQDHNICLQGNAPTDALTNPVINEFKIQNPRLCMEQIVMSPEYVAAFEAALLANSSAQGIQIPFTTYYTYKTSLKARSTAESTFWVRKPVRYLKGVYWAAYPRGGGDNDYTNNPKHDAYRPARQLPDVTRAAEYEAGTGTGSSRISKWQVAIGTKSYREIDDQTNVRNFECAESEIQFQKAVGHYNDYATGTDEITAQQRVLNNSVQGIDLEFSPDNDVLASETTLNSNDIRIKLKQDNLDMAVPNAAQDNAQLDAFNWDVIVMCQYQASVALFPGNETRLLVT